MSAATRGWHAADRPKLGDRRERLRLLLTTQELHGCTCPITPDSTAEQLAELESCQHPATCAILRVARRIAEGEER